MTRINVVDPGELSNEHLLAEYRELPRLRHAYPRRSPPDIPPTYRLGPGHVTFFYDKGAWLQRRHARLRAEMQRRGFRAKLPPLDLSHWPPAAMNDWTTTEQALRRNRFRIGQRLNGG